MKARRVTAALAPVYGVQPATPYTIRAYQLGPLRVLLQAAGCGSVSLLPAPDCPAYYKNKTRGLSP